MAAVDVALSADDLAALDQAAPRGSTAGPRYGEADDGAGETLTQECPMAGPLGG